MKYNRLRRIRDAKEQIKKEYHLSITYYYIKALFEKGNLQGIRIGNTIYINYDDLIKQI